MTLGKLYLHRIHRVQDGDVSVVEAIQRNGCSVVGQE